MLLDRGDRGSVRDVTQDDLDLELCHEPTLTPSLELGLGLKGCPIGIEESTRGNLREISANVACAPSGKASERRNARDERRITPRVRATNNTMQ